MRNWSITFTLLASVFFNLNAYAKQTILLDTNGNPLSEETLLLLSNSSGKFESISTNKKTTSNPKHNAAPIKRIATSKRVSDPLLKKELLSAMKAGNVSRINELLKAGVTPTYKNYKGETPLGIAVSRGWGSMVISLLEHGANINEKGTKGITLLHVASAKGLTDMAKVLVRGGLSPSKRTAKNWTSLHVAARYNHWQLVDYYISLGVDPDIRNTDGRTALSLARQLRHQQTIKSLSRVSKTNRDALNIAQMKLLMESGKPTKTKKQSRKKRRS